MPDYPRLSICIPTFNRDFALREGIEGAIAEARTLPDGEVEVLVSDNCSTDGTPAVIADCAREYPWLRCFRNAENLGFDRNYLNCVEKARGEFVWIVGDDDVVQAGSVARLLRVLDAGADACLCAAQEVDKDHHALGVRTWYREPQPEREWILDGRRALIDYLNLLQFNAGIFAFISVLAFRRERFLVGRSHFEQGIGSGYIHVWGMLRFIQSTTRLYWIPESLVQNDVTNDTFGQSDPFGRWMYDLDAWLHLADAYFSADPELRSAFLSVVRRNHSDRLVSNLLLAAGEDHSKWDRARAGLLNVEFPQRLVRGVELGCGLARMDQVPSENLDGNSLCLADLPLVARGARRVAVLAEGVPLDEFIAATPLLDAFRARWADAVRVVCSPDMVPFLSGFDLQVLARESFLRDDTYMKSQLDGLRDFRPELIVNLNRRRGAVGDLLILASHPIGALGFAGAPERIGAARLDRARNEAYHRLLLPDAPCGALADALGMSLGRERLWLDPAEQGKAQALFRNLGWDPGRTLAVLGNEPAALTEGGLGRACRDGWHALGLGGPGTETVLAPALELFAGRGFNLGGALPLGTMIALLQACAGFLGGTPIFQSLARAAGSRPFMPAGARDSATADLGAGPGASPGNSGGCAQ